MSKVSNHPQIEALVQGDPETYRFLYQELMPKVVAFVMSNSGTAEDGEEIFQDALFQLIARAKVSGVEIRSSFDGYVFTVCRNLWFRELKKSKKEVRNETVIALRSEEEDLEAIVQQQRWDLFEEMLEGISGKCAELLADYFKKMPYSEIVAKYEYASENAAFQRVFKCKKKLTDLIKADPRFKNLYDS